MGSRRLFALSDPHLSLGGAKPMHIFGAAWDNHVERLREGWLSSVGDGDVVLCPGDISWAMRFPEALVDLTWLAALPGEKVLLRGNHDYWWQSVKKMREAGLPRLHFLQNDCLELPGVTLGGSRLWDFPGIRWGYAPNAAAMEAGEEKREKAAPARGEDADKIRARELERLRLSLGKMAGKGGVRVAMTHYPPLGEDGAPTMLTDVIGSFGIDICVFGHVHALLDRPHPGADATVGGTRYVLAASDHLRHRPLHLCDL